MSKDKQHATITLRMNVAQKYCHACVSQASQGIGRSIYRVYVIIFIQSDVLSMLDRVEGKCNVVAIASAVHLSPI